MQLLDIDMYLLDLSRYGYSGLGSKLSNERPVHTSAVINIVHILYWQK